MDLDPERPADISSTDGEKYLAKQRLERIIEYFQLLGISQDSVVTADSGNGYHILLKIELFNTKESTDLCQHVLQALDLKFSDDAVKVDLTTFNASRISKLYGTLAVKGDSTSDRPHRIAKLIQIPQNITPVSHEILKRIAAGAPKQPEPESFNRNGSSIDIEKWMHQYGLEWNKVNSWNNGKRYILKSCPFNSEHNRGEAVLIQFNNGALAFKCQHDSCADKDWQSLREKYEPKPFRSKQNYARSKDKRKDKPDSALPSVHYDDKQLREVGEETLNILYQGNKPEKIFVRGGNLCRICFDENHRPYIEALNESALMAILTNACNFYKTVGSGKNERTVSISPPPIEIIRYILAKGAWQFPPLISITETPQLRPDGTILNQPGYDKETHLYYFPDAKLVIPAIPDNPTDEDIKQATELILEVKCDFPYDSEASHAHAIASMITPIIKPLIGSNSCIPGTLYDKPQVGTGATYNARIDHLIATGLDAELIPLPEKDEETKKLITTAVIKGKKFFILDNVDRIIRSLSIAVLLTNPVWTDHILGSNKEISCLHNLQVIITGNNLYLNIDLCRRSILSRLDAKEPWPWEKKKQYKHERLFEWVANNRGKILAAIFTIAKAWVIRGQPKSADNPSRGGFEQYCDTVGGILNLMGVKGFLANSDALYEESDTETPAWENLLIAWHELLPGKALTAGQVKDILEKTEYKEFKDALDNIIDSKEKDLTRKLGNALAKKKDVRFPCGLMLVKAGLLRRFVKWKCVSLENADSHQFSLNVSPCESPCGQSIHDDSNTHNEDGVINDSPRLTSASKECESPEKPITRLPEDLLTFWASEGKPIIYLGTGENCEDLEKRISYSLNERQFKALVDWYAKHHKEGKNETTK